MKKRVNERMNQNSGAPKLAHFSMSTMLQESSAPLGGMERELPSGSDKTSMSDPSKAA